jgi:hypothetical protein
MAQCRPIFSSGCYHGVVEAYLNTRGRIDIPALDAMCRAAGDETQPGPVFECMHGLGHGILGAVGMDAMEALGYCDRLDSQRYVTSCHEGVFMEAVSSELVRNHGGKTHVHTLGAHADTHRHSTKAGRLTIDFTDPYSPCRNVAAPYDRSCWLFQGFLILRRVGFDAGKALALCEAAPAGWPTRCAEGVGHQMAGLFQRDDEWIRSRCEETSTELGSACIDGAIYALVSADWSGTRGVAFCSSLGHPRDVGCFQVLGPLLHAVTSEAQQATACAKAAPDFRRACRSGEGAT